MSRSRTRRYGHLEEIKEINVMPLVDLLLQLFIAVIIFFPVVEYGMNINLPKGTTSMIEREKTRTISVDRLGYVYINDVKKTPQQFRDEIKVLAQQSPSITVLIKADEANNYGAVMKVLTDLHAAKITRIALLTQEDAARTR
jgi:biopolymer transport protein ExbD